MFKKLRFLTNLFLLITFLSCNDNPKKEPQIETNTNTEITKPKTVPTEEVKNVATNFGGNWVNKKYMDKLLATKSPKKSQDVSPITMLILPNQFNQKATTIFEFHEGTTGKVVDKNGVISILTEEGEEPELPLKFEKEKLTLKNDEFVRLKSAGTKSDYKVAEQLLFAGKYNMNGKTVELTSEGKITGLDLFKFYSIPIDYYDSGMQVDQIKLGNTEKDSKPFAFEFKKNKLIIYELKCVKQEGEFCQVVKNGKKLYEMVKE